MKRKKKLKAKAVTYFFIRREGQYLISIKPTKGPMLSRSEADQIMDDYVACRFIHDLCVRKGLNQ